MEENQKAPESQEQGQQPMQGAINQADLAQGQLGTEEDPRAPASDEDGYTDPSLHDGSGTKGDGSKHEKQDPLTYGGSQARQF